MSEPRHRGLLHIGDVSEWAGWLPGAVRAMFGHRLEELHSWPHLGELPGDVSREADQSSRAHRQFYRLFPRIEARYLELAELLGRSWLSEEFYVQRVPTFRVHFPGSRAVGEPHTDYQYGHQPGELTFWIPLTEATETSTIWVANRIVVWQAREYTRLMAEGRAEEAEATLPGPVSMYPVNLSPGMALIFDSVHRTHANAINQTGATRVSLDFRVLPASLHQPETRRHAVNTGTRMVLGGYWRELPPPRITLSTLIRDELARPWGDPSSHPLELAELAGE